MKKEDPVNILLTSAGRRSYLVKYFQEAVKGNGKIHAANSSAASTALEAADQAVVTPIMVPALRYFLPSCVGTGFLFFMVAMRTQYFLCDAGKRLAQDL